MPTPHSLYYDQDRWHADGPDEPPQRRVGTCCQCGRGVYAWIIGDREVVEPCDCEDDELHDDRPGGF